MTDRPEAALSGLDEIGLEVPFAPEAEAVQRASDIPLANFGETPFSETSEASWSESFPGEAFEPEQFGPEHGEFGESELDAAEYTSAAEANTSPHPAADTAQFLTGPALRRGGRGASVATLQRYLVMLGANTPVNGKYGHATEAAVRAFQSRSGLKPDGIAGARTRAAIAAALRGRGAPSPVAPAAPPRSVATPASGNRLVIKEHALLRGHRGTPPDLILKWNRIDDSGEIDVVVHFHGYSGQKQDMRIDRDKEARSGLDFSDPKNSAAPGRDRPTLAVLPRGNYFGGQSGAGYDFPNLIEPGALQALIDDALTRLGQQTGRSFRVGRLIFTGHSGGGAPVSAILAHMDPDEVHIFDGMYGSAKNVIAWAKKRIARENRSASALPPALRVLYRQGSTRYPGTQPNSETIARELRAALSDPAVARLRPFFRVDKTAVEHNDIPGRFGWILLANAGSDLPGVKTYGSIARTGESYEPETFARWEDAPTLREESEREASGMSEQNLSSPGQDYGEHTDESLAWLDVEAPGMEAEWFEPAMPEAEEFTGEEGFESSEFFEPEESYTPEGESDHLAYAEEWLETDSEQEGNELERFGEFEDERDAEWAAGELGEEFEEESSLDASGLTTAEKKAVEITSTLETGKRGGFYGLSGNFDGQALSFGLVNWTIGTGSLQPLLRDFAAEQPQRWASVFGADAARFLQLIARKDANAIKEQRSFAIREMNVCKMLKGKPRWAIREPWVGYFKRLSEDPEFQKIQIRYVRNLLARAEYFCRYFNLKSEQAFTFMFDAVSSHGKWWLTKKFGGKEKRRLLIEQRIAALVGRYGQGMVPESEILLAIADVLGATSAPRWAAMVRQRKRWFVTGQHPRAKELAGLEPRADVPYSASAGPRVTPAPGPAPAPAPAPAPLAQPQQPTDLCNRIAQVAEQEFQRWHPHGGAIGERDNAAVPILQQYYREGVHMNVSAANLQSAAWQDHNPWSAVFISWVMRTAGAGSAFAYSPGHWVYISAARRNRLNGVTSNPFWAYRVSEVAPQVGDIICTARGNSGATYDNIGDSRGHKAHGDVVTEVHPGFLRVIGGNVGRVNQTVGAKKIATLADGRLSLQGNQSGYFAIVRCRGPVGNVHPSPAATPATPPAPAPAAPAPRPASKKLSPAQFVAAFGASARASEAKHGVPRLVTLGQAALESGWGAHAPRFNFFGIKAKASDPEATRQLLKTREVLSTPNHKFPKVLSVTPRSDGKYDYVVCDWFRAYPDAAGAFDAHGEFLSRNKRYANAFKVANDPYAFAAEVARAGYATDPSYERVLAGVMRTVEAADG